MRGIGHNVIVSNGSQTDMIYDKLMLGSGFLASLENETYEPDEPNYTPRISGFIDKNRQRITLSIIKRIIIATYIKNIRNVRARYRLTIIINTTYSYYHATISNTTFKTIITTKCVPT